MVIGAEGASPWGRGSEVAEAAGAVDGCCVAGGCVSEGCVAVLPPGEAWVEEEWEDVDFFLEEPDEECLVEDPEREPDVPVRFFEGADDEGALFEGPPFAELFEELEELFFLAEDEDGDLPEDDPALPWCALRIRSFFCCSVSSARRLRIPMPESIRSIRSSLRGAGE